MSNEPTNLPAIAGRPRRPWRRIAIATLIGGLVAGLGAKVFAQGGPGFGHCGMHRMHGAGFMDQSPEAMQPRVEAWVKWTLADVKATDAQQKAIGEIVTAAAVDLKPLREQHRAARESLATLLAQPTIDRGALEGLRAREIELGESASRRITQALADAAEVLSPEQRSRLVERVQQMRRRWT